MSEKRPDEHVVGSHQRVRSFVHYDVFESFSKYLFHSFNGSCTGVPQSPLEACASRAKSQFPGERACERATGFSRARRSCDEEQVVIKRGRAIELRFTREVAFDDQTSPGAHRSRSMVVAEQIDYAISHSFVIAYRDYETGLAVDDGLARAACFSRDDRTSRGHVIQDRV